MNFLLGQKAYFQGEFAVSFWKRWVNDFWSFFIPAKTMTRHLCPGPSVDHHCDEHQQDDHWYIGDLHKQ